MTSDSSRIILRGRAVTASGTLPDAAVVTAGPELASVGPADAFWPVPGPEP